MLEKFKIIYKNGKFHGIEDHLLDQIKTYNGIRYFIEDFIEQTYRFSILDGKRIANMRDRKKHHLIIPKMKVLLIMVKLN